MILEVERFKKGHPLFSDALIKLQDKFYGSVFGQLMADEKFVCYTMERLDTLIAEGVYNITYHNSPSNKAICPHLYSATCAKSRYILMHVANFAYQLKGCTALGTGIDLKTPSLISSKIAFEKVTKLFDNKPLTIKYTSI